MEGLDGLTNDICSALRQLGHDQSRGFHTLASSSISSRIVRKASQGALLIVLCEEERRSPDSPLWTLRVQDDSTMRRYERKEGFE